MAELFAILFIIELVLVITTIILFLSDLERLGAFIAAVMLIMLIPLFITGLFIELENLLISFECSCENCTRELIGRK